MPTSENRATRTREISVYGLGKRLRRATKRFLGRWTRGDYDVRVIQNDGRAPYKRVRFDSLEWASEVHANLQAFEASPHLPTAIDLEARDVFSDFIKGRRPTVIDAAMLEKLADFYAAVYAKDPILKPFSESTFAVEWERCLKNLVDLRVLDELTAEKLSAHARQLAPELVWVGYDYTDPITPNLVVSDELGCICAIDIKNLRSNRLIGCGVARAQTRWLKKDKTQQFLTALVHAGAPDVRPYFEYIKLFERVQRVSAKMTTETKRKGSSRLKHLRRKPLKLAAFMDD